MNTSTQNRAAPPRKMKKALFAMALGGMSGFIASLVFLRLGDSGTFGNLGASEEVAALVAIIYLLVGIAMCVGLIAPKAGAKFLNVEDAEEIREQRIMLTSSAAATLAVGGALLVMALASPAGLIAPSVAGPVFVVLAILAVALSIVTSRYQDELMRAIGAETGATAFYLLALIGGGWAVLAHLELAGAPGPLDWLTMIWGLMLLAAMVVIARRGLLTMR